jgi:colicin import membrane protein
VPAVNHTTPGLRLSFGRARAAKHLVGLALVLLLTPLAAACQQAAEREALRQERERITAQMAQEDAACQQRFAVTACVDDVKRRRRESLAPLRERELQWDDAERRARVSRREEALAGKRQAHGAAAHSAAAASGPRPVVKTRQQGAAPAEELAVVPAQTPLSTSNPQQQTERAAVAAQRVRAAAARQAAAQAAQAVVAKRQADRAARGKLPTPLPVPLLTTQPPATSSPSSSTVDAAHTGAKPKQRP